MHKSVFLTCMLFLAVAADAQWAYKGLGGVHTYQLTIDQDTMYASTTDGLYKKYLLSNDTVWQQVAFPGKTVLNTLFLDQQSCLVMVALDPLLHTVLVYRSDDRGQTSSLFIPDTASYAYPYLAHMTRSPFGKDTIYLLNHQLKTYDGGQNWMPLGHSQQNDNFIYVNPANSKEVFIGGENLILSPFLQHSADNGQSWDIEDCSSYFAGDNALEVLHVIDGDWYAAGEGIVGKRLAGSSSWTQLLDVYSSPSWALYMFGFAFSPVNNSYLYASGDNSNTDINGKLRMLKSSDGGQSWDSVSYSMPGMIRYGVYDLKIQHVWGEDRVWLGGWGVFTYSQGVLAGVNDHEKEVIDINLFPNPAHDVVNLAIKERRNIARVRLMNGLGQEVFSGSFSTSSPIAIPVKRLVKGVYYCSVGIGSDQRGLKFIKD